jgi:hypothetical protein
MKKSEPDVRSSPKNFSMTYFDKQKIFTKEKAICPSGNGTIIKHRIAD